MLLGIIGVRLSDIFEICQLYRQNFESDALVSPSREGPYFRGLTVHYC